MVLFKLDVFLLMSIYGHKTDMAFLTFEPENVTDFTIKVRIFYVFYTKIVKFLFQKTLKARKFCYGGSFKAF